jgi:hypothetical protein
MGHYAKVLNGKVISVIVAEKEFFDTFVDSSPGEWIQTSYNTRGNVHYGPDGQPDGGVPLRANYAGIGYIYDSENDVFYHSILSILDIKQINLVMGSSNTLSK